MPYVPLKSVAQVSQSVASGTMPVMGTNLRDFSQLLDTNNALYLENYWLHGSGRLVKRKGTTERFDTGDSDPISLDEDFQNNYEIVGSGTNVRAYNTVSETFTDIKTNFTADNGGFSGVRTGDYFFVTNILDGLWRIALTLAYDAQSVNFTVNRKLTGTTSGATAIVLQDSDSGATGTLTLGSVNGTFLDNEPITDTSGGAAVVNGTLTFSITEITAAPKAKFVAFTTNRLLLYNLQTNPSGWAYSAADTGTNPPFTSWSTASGFNDPGSGYYRNGETATSFGLIGDTYFLTFTKGWHAFIITQTEIAGVSSKYDQPVQTSDLGIQKVLMTDVGLIACGKFGVKRLISLGQPNIPYSEQWEALTDQLGEEYFIDVNFEDSSIVYDDKRGYIYIACAKGGGTTNNFALAIKADLAGAQTEVKTGATSFFTGLNPYRFLKKDGEIYMTSSIDGISYNLFDGENDDGNEIYSQYYQELNFGTFTDTFNLDEFKAEGELSSASSLTISFDTFDENGYFQSVVDSYAWNTYNSYSGGGGWGGSPWGSSGWGSSGTVSGLIYDVAGAMPKLRNITRLRVRFESSDTADHIIALFSARVSITHATRNVKLTQI